MTTVFPNSFLENIRNKTAKILVVGQGYVGLPLAVEFAREGFIVTGLDASVRKIELLKSGRSVVDDIKDEDVQTLVESDRYLPTNEYSAIAEQDVILICVPTPLSKTKDPDLSFIISSVEGLTKYLKKGQLVVLESTSYPGTTDELILPMLQETGLQVGADFYLAFSPERIDPGNEAYPVRNIPKVVGGITEKCGKIAATLYRQIINQIVVVSSTRSAEMVKLLENTFRSVNIGLVNEIAQICDRLGIDVWETIDAAATKPFGYMPFYPGPGLGGHCIPIDPHYLSWKLKTLNYNTRFISLASEINSNMPYYVTSKIVDILNKAEKSVKNSEILILGVTYKADISDERESPAFEIIEILQNKGARVKYHDPYVAELTLKNQKTLNSIDLSPVAIDQAECVVIVTNHSIFNIQSIVDQAKAVIDTRNATKFIDHGLEKVTKL